MPRFPDQRDLGRRNPIIAVGGVNRAPDASVAFEGVERAADMLSSFLEEEKRRNDKLRTEDAVNKLNRELFEIENGEDGFTHKKSSDAVNGTFYKDYDERITQSINGLSESLGNDEQREDFKRRSEAIKLNYNNRLVSHLSRERQVYQKEVYKGGLELESQNARSNWHDSNAIGASLERALSLHSDYAEAQGIAPELAAAQRNEVKSYFHQNAIEAALSNDAVGYAREYFEKVSASGELSAEQAEVLKQKIEIGDSLDRQRNLADQIIETTDNLGDALKKAKSIDDAADRDKVVSRVKSEYADRQAIEALEEDERFDALLAKVDRGEELNPNELYGLSNSQVNALNNRGRLINSDPEEERKLKFEYDSLMAHERAAISQADLWAKWGNHPDFDQISRDWSAHRQSITDTTRKQAQAIAENNFETLQDIKSKPLSTDSRSTIDSLLISDYGFETIPSKKDDEYAEYSNILLNYHEWEKQELERKFNEAPEHLRSKVTLTIDEKRAGLARLLSSKSSKGTFGGEVFTAGLSKEEFRNKKLIVNGRKIDIKDYPQEVIDDAVRSRRERGLDTDLESVMQQVVNIYENRTKTGRGRGAQ